jgi:hypothetical protein
MKLSWETLPLTDPLVVAELECSHNVMIDEKSRWGRHFLRLHKDKLGWFVRTGCRGGNKQRLGRAKVTFVDDKPSLFKFTFASRDAFDAEQSRIFDELYGIEA